MFKIKQTKIMLLFCFGLIQSGLFAQQKMPDWVNTPSKEFPSKTYFYYVGEGNSRSQAELKAVKGLAAIFQQDITSASVSSARMEQAKKDGKVATAKISSISEDIIQSVNVDDLVGIEIRENWFDKSVDTYYAIAVMDKQKASQMYVSLIKTNLKEINNLLLYDMENQFSFEIYARLDLAREIAVLNEKYFEKLKVIDSDAHSVLFKENKSSKSIRMQQVKIAKEIPIFIEVTGDYNDSIANALASVVTSMGFRTSQDSSVQYSIICNLVLEKNIPKDKSTVQCRYSLEGNFTDEYMFEQLFPISLNGRESHNNFDSARDRTIAAITKKINSEVKSAFQSYLASIKAE